MKKLILGFAVLSTLLFSSPAHAAFGGCAFGDCGSGSGGVGGGASISDAAYGSGWNGDTTNGASKNAIYDKIETIVAGGLDFALDSSTSGNIRYVGCSDSIDAAIIAASAGDTLELGSCSYSLSAAMTTITKAIKIKGQGKEKTILNTSTNAIGTLFPSTADGLQIESLTVRGTRLGIVFSVDLQAGTSSSGVNNVFKDVEIDCHNTSTYCIGIYLMDTGAVVLDSEIYIGGADWSTTGQNYGIQNDTHSTSDNDNYLFVKNTHIENISTDTVGNNNAIIRGIRFYNFNNGDDPYNMYLTMQDVTIENRDDAAPHNAIEALHMQGARIIAYVYNSTLDGYGSSTTNTQNKLKDFRCDDGAVCHFINTAMVGGFWQISGGTVYREGYLGGNGLILSQGNADGPATDGVAATAVISATGATGGAGVGTGARAGGQGANVSIVGGVGGLATAATTTGTGGAGGPISLVAGAGGSQTTTSSTTNVGGAGGDFTIAGGAGGTATGASVTNTGGRGGRVLIYGGDNASGGLTGNVCLGINSAGTRKNKVGIGTLAPTAPVSISAVATESFDSVTSTRLLDITDGTDLYRFFAMGSSQGLGISTPNLPIRFDVGTLAGTMALFGSGNTASSYNTYLILGRTLEIGGDLKIDGIWGGIGAAPIIIASANGGADVGIGSTSHSARLHIIKTAEQLRVGYDTSNYVSETVSSTGGVTIDAVGSGSAFTFNDPVSSTNTITSSRTTDLGWSIVTGANTACNTTCTSACVHGWDTTAGVETAVACTDATADKCLCAGAS